MIDNIARLREIQLELLRVFSDCCEKHGLKWYAFFGTLLGVARNEGYLPLDDDIDVVMPMEDYIRLCQNREWFDAAYYLQTPLDYGLSRYARLHKKGTTAFRGSFTDCLKTEGYHGICIDIIPLAELPGMQAYHTPTVLSEEKNEAVYPKAWFEPAGTGRFEGMTVRIPAKPRKVLNEAYDDWAWPHGAAESRPRNWFFDTENGFESYVRRYTGMLEGIEGKKIILFGAADTLRIWLERFGLRSQVLCALDNDAGKWGKESCGVTVRAPSELPDLMDEQTRVIVVSLWHQEIGKQLERMGISEYYVYLDDYYDEKIGNKVVRREDANSGTAEIAKWQ